MEVNLECTELEESKQNLKSMQECMNNSMAVDSSSNECSTSVKNNMTMDTKESAGNSNTNVTSSNKTLKRCLSVPIIHTLPGGGIASSTSNITTRSAAAAAAACSNNQNTHSRLGMRSEFLPETPKKYQQNTGSLPDSSTSAINTTQAVNGFGNSIHISIPRSNPCSR